jgi:hypothetical protein
MYHVPVLYIAPRSVCKHDWPKHTLALYALYNKYIHFCAIDNLNYHMEILSSRMRRRVTLFADLHLLHFTSTVLDFTPQKSTPLFLYMSVLLDVLHKFVVWLQRLLIVILKVNGCDLCTCTRCNCSMRVENLKQFFYCGKWVQCCKEIGKCEWT